MSLICFPLFYTQVLQLNLEGLANLRRTYCWKVLAKKHVLCWLNENLVVPLYTAVFLQNSDPHAGIYICTH